MKTTHNPILDQLSLPHTPKERKIFRGLVRPLQKFVEGKSYDPDQREDFELGLEVIESLSWSDPSEIDFFDARLALDLVCFFFFLRKGRALSRKYIDALFTMARWPCAGFCADGKLPPPSKVFSGKKASDDVRTLYLKLRACKLRHTANFTTLDMYRLSSYLQTLQPRSKALADLKTKLWAETVVFGLALAKSTVAKKLANG